EFQRPTAGRQTPRAEVTRDRILLYRHASTVRGIWSSDMRQPVDGGDCMMTIGPAAAVASLGRARLPSLVVVSDHAASTGAQPKQMPPRGCVAKSCIRSIKGYMSTHE